MSEEQNIITIGYHKGEMDFGVNGSIESLSLEELRKLREMIVVATWCAEDMWRRAQKEEIPQMKGTRDALDKITLNQQDI